MIRFVSTRSSRHVSLASRFAPRGRLNTVGYAIVSDATKKLNKQAIRFHTQTLSLR